MALAFADMGFETVIVGKALNWAEMHYISMPPSRASIQHYLRRLVKDVNANRLIKVHLNTEVEKIEGYVGNFATTLRSGNVSTPIRHGETVVATGAPETTPHEYLSGEDNSVITQLELDKALL